MEQLIPTKANLMKANALLDFSIKGFDLLDKKRNVLIREMMSLISRAEKIQNDIEDIFSQAYSALIDANITMSSASVEEIAMCIPKDEDIMILPKSIMGVEMPSIKNSGKEKDVNYGFFRTNIALDTAIAKMNILKLMVYELAEVENSVFRLAMEIKKTRKRANALEKIQIPRYKEITKNIEEILEEKDREDFFRLKRVKSKTKGR